MVAASGLSTICVNLSCGKGKSGMMDAGVCLSNNQWLLFVGNTTFRMVAEGKNYILGLLMGTLSMIKVS